MSSVSRIQIKALSVVSPHGQNIRSGQKRIEVRSWVPDLRPNEDLLLVENQRLLLKDGETDPKGRAVAIIRITKVRPFLQTDLQASLVREWKPNLWAWEISEVRPISDNSDILAARKIYELQVPANLIPENPK